MPVREKIFRLREGVNRFDSGISFLLKDELDLEIRTLENISPRYGFLETAPGLRDLQVLDDGAEVNGFPSYINPRGRTTHIYAVTTGNIYQFLSGSQTFDDVSLFTLTDTTDVPVAFTPWDSNVFITKLGQPVLSARGGRVELASLLGAVDLSAKYLINAENHLMFGNIMEGEVLTEFPRRLQWSDLNVPLTYTISGASEAGNHNFEPGDQEITGLARGRGFTYVFMRDSVYSCTYVGLPGIFTFYPIVRNFGNIYHYAVIEAAGMVFFIGPDNFYALDGTQLTPIGDQIWKYFQDTLDVEETTTNIRSGYNPVKGEVFWLYQRNNTSWMLIYNYQNRKWSWRDPNNAKTYQFFSTKPAGVSTWKEQTYAWDSVKAISTWDNIRAVRIQNTGVTWDEQNYPWSDSEANRNWNAFLPDSVGSSDTVDRTSLLPYNSFVGLPFGLVRNETMARGIAGGPGLVGELETYEFHLGTIFFVKEIRQIKLLYKQVGNVALSLRVGHRSATSSPVIWSEELLSTNMLPEDAVFEITQTNLNELIRLKFNWTNDDVNYIEEVYAVALKVNSRGEA